MLVPGVCGIPAVTRDSLHSSTRRLRKSGVKAPAYAMVLAEMSASPTRSPYSWLSFAQLDVHRTLSDPRDSVKIPARSNRPDASSNCRAKSSFFSLAPVNCASSLAILSNTCFSVACALARAAMVTSKLALASASNAFFGSTMSTTRLYVSMARTHMHMALHALLAFSMAWGVKLGSAIMGAICLMIFSGMLSLSYFCMSLNSWSALPKKLFWAALK
mmetsp:Transcript_85194/g.170476  ORF Transcript_85194/g.170476 Transcript_85194/m.170476 type:complete len:217 (-) Transcript_85194:1711-2361(-)